eukprot:2417306-Amphidinium_carterae.1
MPAQYPYACTWQFHVRHDTNLRSLMFAFFRAFCADNPQRKSEVPPSHSDTRRTVAPSASAITCGKHKTIKTISNISLTLELVSD